MTKRTLPSNGKHVMISQEAHGILLEKSKISGVKIGFMVDLLIKNASEIKPDLFFATNITLSYKKETK